MPITDNSSAGATAEEVQKMFTTRASAAGLEANAAAKVAAKVAAEPGNKTPTTDASAA
jgi:hypothetical protein